MNYCMPTAIIIMLLSVVAAVGQLAESKTSKNLNVRLFVLSKRQMGEEESRRLSGPRGHVDYIVRFRLENNELGEIDLYSYPISISPVGFRLQRRDGIVYWPTLKGDLVQSPGIDYWPAKEWIGLPEKSAIEWEEHYDSREGADGGETQARTIFIRYGFRNDRIFEVTSDFFEIPLKKP